MIFVSALFFFVNLGVIYIMRNHIRTKFWYLAMGVNALAAVCNLSAILIYLSHL